MRSRPRSATTGPSRHREFRPRKRCRNVRCRKSGRRSQRNAQSGPEDPCDVREDGRRWRAASGRAGRRLLGPELPVQIRYQTAADRQGLRLRRRADFRGSEEHPVSERHDARLQGITDAVGLRVRESECDEELRLRDVVFGLSFHPQNMPQDYFAFLELPRNLAIDAKDLEKKFYALSRQLHPDMHSRKSQAERDQAEESTAILNDAYRTLRDPITRAEYLLKLEGFDTSEQTSKDVPPDRKSVV